MRCGELWRNTSNTMENETQTKLSDSILKRIEAGETVPRPRSYFVLRGVTLWCMALLSLFLGALAVATIIFRISNFLHLLPPPDETFSYELIEMLPFLWFLVLGLFGYVAYREFRHTRGGYKYELSTVLLGMVVVSGMLGFALYSAGTGYVLDRFAGRFVPFQPDVEHLQRERWLRPEHGLLVGEVVEELVEGFILRDLEGEEWRVIFGHTLPELPDEVLNGSLRVGVRGVVSEEDEHAFIACHYRILELAGRGVFAPAPPTHRPFASSTEPHERNSTATRTTKCEDVRPLDMNS